MKNRCGLPTAALQYNLKAHAKGKAPKRLSGWPYARLQNNDRVIVNNVQDQVNLIWKTYQPQESRQECDCSSSCSSDNSDHEVHCPSYQSVDSSSD